MLNEFNFLHPNIQYTIEKQTNDKLNYLDITNENTLTFSMNRKPTATDISIHNDWCRSYSLQFSGEWSVNRELLRLRYG
jgi:hypothetical protein